MNTYAHLWLYLAQFFLEWEIFQANIFENVKTHILYSRKFLIKPCRIWGNGGKYGRAGKAADNITGHMRIACWITTARDTLIKCNTYCFYTAKMVRRTRFSVTLLATPTGHISCNAVIMTGAARNNLINTFLLSQLFHNIANLSIFIFINTDFVTITLTLSV